MVPPEKNQAESHEVERNRTGGADHRQSTNNRP